MGNDEIEVVDEQKSIEEYVVKNDVGLKQSKKKAVFIKVLILCVLFVGVGYFAYNVLFNNVSNDQNEMHNIVSNFESLYDNSFEVTNSSLKVDKDSGDDLRYILTYNFDKNEPERKLHIKSFLGNDDINEYEYDIYLDENMQPVKLNYQGFEQTENIDSLSGILNIEEVLQSMLLVSNEAIDGFTKNDQYIKNSESFKIFPSIENMDDDYIEFGKSDGNYFITRKRLNDYITYTILSDESPEVGTDNE